ASNELFLQSHEYFNDGNYEKSEELLSKIIQKNPLYSRAYSSLSLIRDEQQRLAEFIQLNLDALSINPRNFRAIYNLGWALHRGWYNKDASWFFKRSIEYYPPFKEILKEYPFTDN
ncbi:uncharacterized protein METZ01_LOCUS425206, partial [marine metagenome]